MDEKCYLWIFNNLNKYSFDADTISIKENISRLLITEDSISSPEIIQKMEAYYKQILANFYNNIIGYQNGLSDKKITAAELDCYFITTSDGMVPIGYYRTIRPAEAASMTQSYLDVCKNSVSKEKNKLIGKWQRNVDEISSKYASIKDSKNPSLLKACTCVLSSFILLITSLVTLIRMDVFSFVGNPNNSEIIKNIQNRIPALSSGNMASIVVLIIVLIILILLAIYIALLSKKEFDLINDKRITNEVLNGILNYVTNLEQNISLSSANNFESIYSAARQGTNAIVTVNMNAKTTATINKKIAIANQFVNKNEIERSKINNLIMSVAITVTVLLPLIYTGVVPGLINSIEAQNNQTKSVSTYTTNSSNYDTKKETKNIETPDFSFDENNDYIFPSDSVYLTKSMLDELTKDELALLRNEIYARHGYKFNLEVYKTYFGKKSWYRPNEYFDESMFNEVEKSNKDLIVEYETEKGWR